jgi:ankyrin repeat protein
MRNTSLVFGLLSVAACASSQNAGSPTSSVATAAPAPPYDDAARDSFFDALKRGDDDAVAAALARTPALANARSARGHSAFLAALMRASGNGFVRPQDNRALAAILAQHPTLDAFEAAAAGDVTRVESESAKDPSYVKRVHEIGWTPLHFAAFGGQPGVVEALVARGAEIDAPAKNKFGNTALQVGCLTRQPEVTRVLIAHHADVNFKQNEGVTALHEAALSGDIDTVRMLLDAGADPNARTGQIDDGSTGKSALDFARKGGHADVVALLLARGAHDS